MPGGASIKQTGMDDLLLDFASMQSAPIDTSRYNHGLVKGGRLAHCPSRCDPAPSKIVVITALFLPWYKYSLCFDESAVARVSNPWNVLTGTIDGGVHARRIGKGSGDTHAHHAHGR